MDEPVEFRSKIYDTISSGLYITVAQLQFFLNDDDGPEKYKAGHQDFFDYLMQCQLYNAIYDYSEDPKNTDGFIFWDHENEVISLKIEENSKIKDFFEQNGIIFKEGN